MRLFVSVSVVLAVILIAGCERAPTDPTSQSLAGIAQQESGETLAMKMAHPRPYVARSELTLFPFALSTPDRCPPGYIFLSSATEAGHATHLGRFEAGFSHCIDPITNAYAAGLRTLTAANGDELWLEYSGQAQYLAPPAATLPYSFTGPVTVVGGTGRFAGATGELTESGQAVLNLTAEGWPVGGAGSSVMEGWIEYDPSNE
jgi:hypothetical protein